MFWKWCKEVTDPTSWPSGRRSEGENTTPIGARRRGSSVLRERQFSRRADGEGTVHRKQILGPFPCLSSRGRFSG